MGNIIKTIAIAAVVYTAAQLGEGAYNIYNSYRDKGVSAVAQDAVKNTGSCLKMAGDYLEKVELVKPKVETPTNPLEKKASTPAPKAN